MIKPKFNQDQPKESSHELDRRDFLKCSALLGSVIAAGPLAGYVDTLDAWAAGDIPGAYTHHLPENQIYSVCQQCNTNCGTKVKILDGQVAKIDGNPYSPWNMTPQIPYDTPLKEAALVDGSLCPKGYAGIQALYDPYRIVKVLKRAGKRGENKWMTIPFDQAIKEVVEGGNLFGEGKVDGLKDIFVLKDPELSAGLQKDAAAVAAKKMTLEEFKTKHQSNLQYLIDPNHPDLGPKNNQFCFAWGRLKSGRGDLINRFTGTSYGSANAHGHTTVCQGSLYFTGKAMSEQFAEGKFTNGTKFYWQCDTGNSEFIIFVGANIYDANYGPPLRAQKITQGQVDGGRKIAVIDPRCSKIAARAWKWLPVHPLGVAAAGMAMIRWIIENKRFDARYLANANKAAAKEDNEPTWTQAAWLVKVGPDGVPGPFLRGSDVGLEVEKRPKKGGKEGETWDFDPLLVWNSEKVQPFDPNDEKTPVHGELLVSRQLDNGVKVKSVLQIYKEAAEDKTLAQWAEVAGVKEADLADLAREFTSHGKKAAADLHRGVSQHTSGLYNVVVWMMVNVLIGNHDWTGGMSKLTTYNHVGSKDKPFDLSQAPKKFKPWGVSIIRHGVAYDKTTLFTGYPSKRVWYPFSSDIYQEIFSSCGDQYPYPIKALMLYMGSPVYSLPAGHALISILSDPKKIPLFITSDITIGETSMYSDYIFPDLTYLERWEFSGSHPSVTPKVAPIRQPAAQPLTETVTVFGEKMPLSLEAMLLALAEKLGLPGFGENAFGPGRHFKREEDMYLRMVANIAFGDKPDGSEKVPKASEEEIKTFIQARRHLPPTIFDPKRWESVVGPDLWPHVVYVLNRGGRFQAYHQAYQGPQLANKYGKMIGIYFDNMARTKHSMTGKPYLTYGNYLPCPTDCTGQLIDDSKNGYDLTLITYRSITQTKSRTAGNYWLQAIYPENFIEVAFADAMRLGLKKGDLVKVVSATNPDGIWDFGPTGKRPIVGKVAVKQGLRPGVVAFTLGHGHWAYGAGQFTIDNVTIPGDPRRATGVHANAAMRLDPVLKNTGLVDTVGGSAVFYQTQIKLIKA